MKQRILILGSSSWLGSTLLKALQKDLESYELAATYFNTEIEQPNTLLFQAKTLEDYAEVLKEVDPSVVVNFLRGEDEEGFSIHQAVVSQLEGNGGHYIYASSALALDGYQNIELTEDLPAKSVSEYGIFKARCERMLTHSKLAWTILRFSSLQGYCAHKDTRNEVLLKRLQRGEEILVDSDVIQNRMSVDDMIAIVIGIIQKKALGVMHIGTLDFSDEIEFLKKQAVLFGYDSNQIKSSGKSREVNLNCVPETIFKLFGDEFRRYESDTLNSIESIQEFQKYKTS